MTTKIEDFEEPTVEEIDLKELTDSTEMAMADYNMGDLVKDEPRESVPAVALNVKSQKLAGKYTAFIDNSGKVKDGRTISNMHVFELVKTGKKVGVWGTVVLDGKLKKAEIGKEYIIIAKGKPEGKPWFDYDVAPITPHD